MFVLFLPIYIYIEIKVDVTCIYIHRVSKAEMNKTFEAFKSSIHLGLVSDCTEPWIQTNGIIIIIIIIIITISSSHR